MALLLLLLGVPVLSAQNGPVDPVVEAPLVEPPPLVDEPATGPSDEEPVESLLPPAIPWERQLGRLRSDLEFREDLETVYRDERADGLVWDVSYHPLHVYRYFWQDRLVMVRWDQRYTGDVLGLRMGASRQQVLEYLESTWGSPRRAGEDWLVYGLVYERFPREVRLVFQDGMLADLYLYRSDL